MSTTSPSHLDGSRGRELPSPCRSGIAGVRCPLPCSNRSTRSRSRVSSACHRRTSCRWSATCTKRESSCGSRACGPRVRTGRPSGWNSRRAARSCMPARSPLAPFLEPLERLGLPYCVTGSVAASVYGEPRLTADIDVVLLMKARDVARLRTAFPDAEYYVPPEETLLVEISRSSRGAFNLIHHVTQFKADIYLAASDPLHAWALKRRRRISLEGGQA